MVLAGLGLNPAGVSLFRMRAPQNPFDEELASAWGLNPRVFGPWSWWLQHLLFVVALHHLSVSLGRQNATLGSFTAHGFGRFGLESCWGSPVSDACSTRPFEEELASAWGLNPRVFGPWSWWLHHLLFVVALHHLSVSLGRQNATLGSFTAHGLGRFGLESCWGSPVSDACSTRPFEEELASAWGLNPRVFGPWSWWLHHLLFVVTLHHLSVSLGRQNATLGSFTGDGFGRFGLESCWGFPVSDACPTKPFWRGIGFRLRLESSRFRALILVVAASFVCGCIASSFCFCRPAERNVRQFYGGWFWQVWAWILLGFPCFGCVPHRALWRGIGFRLRLESSRFRALILVVASSFVCGCIASSFCFFRPSERNVRQFYGAWFGQVWAWILLGFVLHKALWRGIGFRLRLESSRFRALILVVASSFVCGDIASSFCFFRPAERNVRQFYGGWFWQVWAWILLGFPCFGCVPTKPFWRGIGFRLRLESSRFRALILVVAASFVCGCIAPSFYFFRPSERNVRQFYGGWFWQVWAWILLGFPCFGCMPHRALWRGIGSAWGLNPRVLRALILVVASSFVCGCIASSSVSLGRQNATLGSFTAHGFGRFGLESCWGFPVSDACPTEPFEEELASAWGLNPRVFGHWSWWLHHLLFVVTLHHLSVSLGRQNATLGSFTGDGFGRFGLEFPVSDACPTKPFWRGIGFRLRLESSRFRALFLVVAASFVCGCIASSFCFFRPSERNVRQFYGGWFWQVWAWILLGFPCFGCVPHRALWRGIWLQLEAWILTFSGLDLGGCIIFCLCLHCIIFLFL